MSVDEDMWWRQFVERIRVEAERRGGTCVEPDEGFVRMEPPPGAPGEVVRLTRYDEGRCVLETGAATSYMSYFVDFEDINGVLKHVLGVLDGGASEFVEISADGEWIGTRSEIVFGPGRRVRSQRPLSVRAAKIEVAQTFGRRIRGWVGE